MAALLCAFYLQAYLSDSALPRSAIEPSVGWWGWFDQSVTLRSTSALASLDLQSTQHHYPLLYSLLGAPFYWVTQNHPFVIIDAACLLGAFAGYVMLARRLGIWSALAGVAFVLVSVSDRMFLRQWIIPWNTTLTGAALWLVLALGASWLDRDRRPLAIGALAGVVLGCRPSDAILLLPCLLTIAFAGRLRWHELVRAAAGATLVLGPILVLHLLIYGFAPSPYMQNSAAIGFTLHDLAWKAYVIWLDPFPWFADGQGLLQRAPWIALGLAGLVPAIIRGRKDRMLAATLAMHGVLYTSYVDLLPTGLWRFLNVHYFVWAIPGYALLALLLLRDLTRRGRVRLVALASVAGTAVLLSVQLVPRRVTAGEPAKAVDFAGPLPPFFDTFFSGKFKLHDDSGVLRDVAQVRLFLYPGGVRAIAMRRDFEGPVAFLPGLAPPGFEAAPAPVRWGISARLVWPPRWMSSFRKPSIPVPTG